MNYPPAFNILGALGDGLLYMFLYELLGFEFCLQNLI